MRNLVILFFFSFLFCAASMISPVGEQRKENAPMLLYVYVSENGTDDTDCGADVDSPCLTLDYSHTTVAIRGADSTTMVVFHIEGVVAVGSVPLTEMDYLLEPADTTDDPAANVLTVSPTAGSVVFDAIDATLSIDHITLEATPSPAGAAVIAMSGTKGRVELIDSTLQFSDASQTTTRVLLSLSGGQAIINNSRFTNFENLRGVVLIRVSENVWSFFIGNSTFTNIGSVNTESSTVEGIINIFVGSVDNTTINIQFSTFSNTNTPGNGGALFIKQTNSVKSSVWVNQSTFSNSTAAGNGGAIGYVRGDSDPLTVTFLFTYLTFDNCSAGGHGQHIFVRGYDFPRIITPANFLKSYLVTEDEDDLWGSTFAENGKDELDLSLLSFLVQPLLSEVYVSANGTDTYACGIAAGPCLTLDFGVTRAAGEGKVVVHIEGTVTVSSLLVVGGDYSLEQFSTSDDPTADVVTTLDTKSSVIMDTRDTALAMSRIVFEATPTTSGAAVVAMSGTNAILDLSNSTFRFSSSVLPTTRELFRVIAGSATIDGCIFYGFQNLLACVLISVGENVQQFSINKSNFTNIQAFPVEVENNNAQGVVNIKVGAADGTAVNIQATNFTNTNSLYSGGALFLVQNNSTRNSVCVNNSVFSNTTALDGIGGAIYYMKEPSDPTLVTFLFTWLTFQDCSSYPNPGNHIFVHGYDLVQIITPANFYMSYSLTEAEWDLWGWTIIDGEPVEGSLLDFLREDNSDNNNNNKNKAPLTRATIVIIVVVVWVVVVAAVALTIGIVIFVKKKKSGFHKITGSQSVQLNDNRNIESESIESG